MTLPTKREAKWNTHAEIKEALEKEPSEVLRERLRTGMAGPPGRSITREILKERGEDV